MHTQFQEISDFQWQYISQFLENNRPKKLSLRSVFNAILWVDRIGAQWRNLESRFPKWQSVYYYFRKWSKDGTFQLIMRKLTKLERTKRGREETPSLCAIDSQSIKLAPWINENRGLDGNKKINGRKRHILVDVEGLLWAIHVGPANQHDGEAGLELLPMIHSESNRLEVIRGDKAYGGIFAESAKIFGWNVDTTQSPPSENKGFVPQQNRWQVERSFAWLNGFRRLSKDYERKTESSESFIALAFCDMILSKF